MNEPTSYPENCPDQHRKKTVRFACDETDHTPSLGRFLACIPNKHGGATNKPQKPEKAVEPSLQMVPYFPRGRAEDSTARTENHNNHPLFSLNEHHTHKLRSPSLPGHILVSDAGQSRGVGSDGPALELGPVSSLRHARVPPRALFNVGNEWIVVPAEQMKQQAEKTKALEDKVKRHKRERILIYDAAMKQAKKKEEEGVNEAKHKFEREQVNMRREVDLELSKISDLYQERCRDYAMMVADECEDEVNKDVAELRQDWARQMKTIEDLVRSDGEDRQTSVIARAVMEQLQEERKDEIAALRADIYSEVKMEFENREVALRDALEADFQADLDGQLLLAEIRHQKEIEALRLELGGGKAPLVEAAAGAIVVYNGEPAQCGEKGEGAPGASSSVRSPPLSRRVLQRRSGSGAGGNLGRKFPFRTPVSKASADAGSKNAHRPAATTERVAINEIETTPYSKQEGQLNGDLTNELMVSPSKVVGVVTPMIGSAGCDSDERESSRSKKTAKRLFSTICS
eukprot:g1459.t1